MLILRKSQSFFSKGNLNAPVTWNFHEGSSKYLSDTMATITSSSFKLSLTGNTGPNIISAEIRMDSNGNRIRGFPVTQGSTSTRILLVIKEIGSLSERIENEETYNTFIMRFKISPSL